MPLELIHSNRDSVRKGREPYLIAVGNTVQSLIKNMKCSTALPLLSGHPRDFEKWSLNRG